jgi:Nif-specific regulatory protein
MSALIDYVRLMNAGLWPPRAHNRHGKIDANWEEPRHMGALETLDSVRSLGLVGSEGLHEVLALVRKVAPCNVSALVTGETGTGKELIARAIHRLSPRVSQPFVAVSCANLPDTLIDDELFGHERGAFTGAATSRRGRFEAAHGGTLFLDEIGDLQLSLQAKLLRVLQERTFERLGSTASLRVDVRLLCATHRNLQAMVKQGTFREDLYHRVNVVEIQLPALRERREGIAPLARHFLEVFQKQFRKPPMTLSEPALKTLEEYDWPGNVRELENMIQRAVVLAEECTIEPWHLSSAFSARLPQHQPSCSCADHIVTSSGAWLRTIVSQ